MIGDYFQKRVDSWLARRIAPAKQITLHQGNLFIFPSKMGVHFSISSFVLFLLGTNYQNNLVLFLVFFMCSFMVTCLLVSYRNVANLTLTATACEAQFVAQECPFHLRLSHTKQMSEGLYFTFQHGDSTLQTTVEGNNVTVYSIGHQRGVFNPGRITVQSRFPFGLYRVWTHIDLDFEVLLYPQPIENNSLVATMSEKNSANNVSHLTHGVDQFSALKRYQPGESLKSVAWKQLAQGRGWLSKQFEQFTGDDLLLDINTLNHLPVETRLSFLCYQVIELEKNNQRYGLTLNELKIGLGNGNVHKHRCLRALALFSLSEPAS